MRRAPLLALIMAAACAHPRPVLYPDEHLKTLGAPAAQKDVDECLAQAKEYLKANPAKRVARRIGGGAVFGAVMGTVFGAFTGDFGRAIGQGAAVGAAAGLAHGAYEAGSPDEIQRAYTQRCLAEKGWSVIGWK
ncbi:MAG: cell envelope biogenesis protein OmpA [Elusimicrobia bacterium]|nr:cell envelope biogenesis protein OmpA [Elusimicrobiota bacterium]